MIQRRKTDRTRTSAELPPAAASSTPQLAQLRTEIIDRLRRHPDLNAGRIEVAVNPKEAVLTGVVSDAEMKQLAETIAGGVDGVHSIRNELVPRFDRITFECG